MKECERIFACLQVEIAKRCEMSEKDAKCLRRYVNYRKLTVNLIVNSFSQDFADFADFRNEV